MKKSTILPPIIFSIVIFVVFNTIELWNIYVLDKDFAYTQNLVQFWWDDIDLINTLILHCFYAVLYYVFSHYSRWANHPFNKIWVSIISAVLFIFLSGFINFLPHFIVEFPSSSWFIFFSRFFSVILATIIIFGLFSLVLPKLEMVHPIPSKRSWCMIFSIFVAYYIISDGAFPMYLFDFTNLELLLPQLIHSPDTARPLHYSQYLALLPCIPLCLAIHKSTIPNTLPSMRKVVLLTIAITWIIYAIAIAFNAIAFYSFQINFTNTLFLGTRKIVIYFGALHIVLLLGSYFANRWLFKKYLSA